MSTLDLIVPGLFGPFAQEVPAHIHQACQADSFKALNRALSRSTATSIPVSDFYSTLHYCLCPHCALSLSEITAQANRMDSPHGFRYRADPVHFKAESDHAILLGPELLELQDKESASLIHAFNTHFKNDGVRLEQDEQGHWYLQTQHQLALDFVALDDALGRDIKHFMPHGDDAMWWRKLVNEAQMLFFQHAVNEQRESTGQLTVNGLWLWDMSFDASLNTEAGTTLAYKHIYADSSLVLSMAKLSKIKVSALFAVTDNFAFEGDSLAVIDSLYTAVCYGDWQAWENALQAFNQQFFLPLYDRLLRGDIRQLRIFSCDGQRLDIDSRQRYQLWKKTHPLSEMIKRI